MPTLNWDGKADAVKVAENIPLRILELDSALSYGDKNSDNLIVQGDNLDALNSLLPFYRGQVKCIYIDPPYNTGAAFDHYNDNFPHAAWLSMIYPRLQLLREFLSDDGSIWINIDDNETHYLKIVCDEIFGRQNFLCDISWEKRYSPPADTKDFGYVHDHILVYRKSKNFVRNLLPITEEQAGRYKNPDNDPRGPWQSADYTCRFNAQQRPNLYYPIIQPFTGEKIYPKKTRVWANSIEEHEKNVRENRIWWGENGKNTVPRKKNFLSEIQQGMMPTSLWHYEMAGTTQDARRESLKLFGENPFDTPKPEKLIRLVLSVATREGDLVLDAFLGSGTTAAVAQKMNRRYIGIELGEQAITHVVPRLKKVIDGEAGGISKSVSWQGGGGFKFYRLGEKIFDEQGTINLAVTIEQLASYVWYSATNTAYSGQKNSPLIGIYKGAAIYLLRDEILTKEILNNLPAHDGEKIIYGTACRIDENFLRENKITFKQLHKILK